MYAIVTRAFNVNKLFQ